MPTGTFLTAVSRAGADAPGRPGDIPGRIRRLLIPAHWPTYTTHYAIDRRPGDPLVTHAATPWYAGGRNVAIIGSVAERDPPARFVVETVGRDGRRGSRPVRLPIAGSAQQEIPLQVANAARFRVVARINNPGTNWVLFTAPFHPTTQTNARLADVGRTVLTAVAVIALLIVPGFAWSALRRRRARLVTVALPGLLGLSLIGAVGWIVGGVSGTRGTLGDPRVLIPVLVWAFLALVLIVLLVRPVPQPPRGVWAVLGIYAVLVLVVAGRGMWAPGPPHELSGGGLVRTMEVGSRNDSRIPFSGALTALAGASPTDTRTMEHYGAGGWTIGDRGAMAPIYAATIVASAGGEHVERLPSLAWQPIDPVGYFAYRIGMGAANLLVVPVLAGLAGALRGRRAAVMAAALAGVTPFLVHEGFFSWPKLLAAMWVLVAGYWALRGKALLTAACLMAGYLTHPLALIWGPAAGLLWMVGVYRQEGEHTAWSVVGLGKIFLRAVALVLVSFTSVAAWSSATAAGRKQSFFVNYFGEVNLHPVHSVHAWLTGRGTSLANTLIPAWLATHHSGDPEMNAWHPTARSPTAIHWLLQVWTTLPFGFGLAAIPLLLWTLVVLARRWPWAFLITVLLPFLLFSGYWGGATTGMMREGLHPLVATLLILCAVCACRSRFGQWLALFAALDVVWVLGTLIGPVLYTHQKLVTPGFEVTDKAALALMLGGVGVLTLAALWVLWPRRVGAPALAWSADRTRAGVRHLTHPAGQPYGARG